MCYIVWGCTQSYQQLYLLFLSIKSDKFKQTKRRAYAYACLKLFNIHGGGEYLKKDTNPLKNKGNKNCQK